MGRAPRYSVLVDAFTSPIGLAACQSSVSERIIAAIAFLSAGFRLLSRTAALAHSTRDLKYSTRPKCWPHSRAIFWTNSSESILVDAFQSAARHSSVCWR